MTETIIEVEKKVEVNRDKCRNIKRFIEEYLKNSNLHGLKYIGERDRTITEKLFWLTVFLCCTGFCGTAIWGVWWKWYDSPLIVSFTETMVPVTEIPFPAITICPDTKSKQTIFNFTEYFHRINPLGNKWRQSECKNTATVTDEERNTFEDISLVCANTIYLFSPKNGRNFSSGSDILHTLMKVSPNLTELFHGCTLFNSIETCNEMITPILTDEGICFTFNALSGKDIFKIENLNKEYLHPNHNMVNSTVWTVDDGFAQSDSVNAYPRRGWGAGAMVTGMIRIRHKDLDNLCKGPVQGFKIYLHNPAEFPRMSYQFFKVGISHEVILAAKPKMIVSSNGLKVFDPLRRQCYFQHERYLRFFKVYTQANCETECWTNFTFNKCSCSQFGLPYGPEMKICNAGRTKCLISAKEKFVTTIDTLGKETEDHGTLSGCKCLPACNSLEYKVEILQREFDWITINKALRFNIPKNAADLHYSKMVVYFKDGHFDRLRRAELYSWADVLSACGGLLGLFMGFSVLSLVEMLYFFTFRSSCRPRQKIMEIPSP